MRFLWTTCWETLHYNFPWNFRIFEDCLHKNRHLSSLDILCTYWEKCLFIFIFRDMLCVILEYIMCIVLPISLLYIRGWAGEGEKNGNTWFSTVGQIGDTKKTHAFFGVKYFESFMMMISLFGSLNINTIKYIYYINDFWSYFLLHGLFFP